MWSERNDWRDPTSLETGSMMQYRKVHPPPRERVQWITTGAAHQQLQRQKSHVAKQPAHQVRAHRQRQAREAYESPTVDRARPAETAAAEVRQLARRLTAASDNASQLWSAQVLTHEQLRHTPMNCVGKERAVEGKKCLSESTTELQRLLRQSREEQQAQARFIEQLTEVRTQRLSKNCATRSFVHTDLCGRSGVGHGERT